MTHPLHVPCSPLGISLETSWVNVEMDNQAGKGETQIYTQPLHEQTHSYTCIRWHSSHQRFIYPLSIDLLVMVLVLGIYCPLQANWVFLCQVYVTFVHLFICSFVHLPICSLAHLLICSFAYSSSPASVKLLVPNLLDGHRAKKFKSSFTMHPLASSSFDHGSYEC